MSLLFSVLISIFFRVQNDWPLYFENDQIKISFKDVICDDIKNGVSFEYYMIEVKNKTNQTLVINYYLGDQKDEENKVAFVLNPLEIKKGNCGYNPVKLKLFKAKTLNKKSRNSVKFSLNNIKTIELY